MPYEWITTDKTAPEHSGAVSVATDRREQAANENAPIAELHLWPYRSLPRKGFVTFIAITCALISLPLIAMLGSPILWALLPFLTIAVAAVWWALERSYRDGAIVEELRLWPDRMTLTRHNPRSATQTWEANPHWVRLEIHPKGGPVNHYMTLSGAGRDVEIGAFLSEDERMQLHGELETRLRQVR